MQVNTGPTDQVLFILALSVSVLSEGEALCFGLCEISRDLYDELCQEENFK